jgi:hemoglobin
MSATQSQSQSLFDRIGGINAVNAAVEIFYTKVMQDDLINHFFRHIDINRQSGKLKAFLAFAFGAPIQYNGKSMRAAHQHMHLTEEHFNAVAGHLVATLTELHVSQNLIDEVVSIALTTKNDILGVQASVPASMS